jgi:hypothetical protein
MTTTNVVDRIASCHPLHLLCCTYLYQYSYITNLDRVHIAYKGISTANIASRLDMHSLSILLLSLPLLSSPVLADTLQSVISAYSLTGASYNYSVPTSTLNSDDATQWIVQKWGATGGKLDFGDNDVYVYSLSLFALLPLTLQRVLARPSRCIRRQCQASSERNCPCYRLRIIQLPSNLISITLDIAVRDGIRINTSINEPQWSSACAPRGIPSRFLLEADGRDAVHLEFDVTDRWRWWGV